MNSYNPKMSVDKGVAAAGTATLGGAVATMLFFGASLLKGEPLTGAALEALVPALTTLGSAASGGFLAWRRNRKKHKRAKSKPPRQRGFPSGYSILLIGALAAATMAGCKTTTTLADGSSVTQYDPVATKAAMETAYIAAVQAYDFWQLVNADREAKDEARYERELAHREARLAEIRAVFERNGWLLPIVERNTGLSLSP